jgi:SAM-dependent methyltransferase
MTMKPTERTTDPATTSTADSAKETMRTQVRDAYADVARLFLGGSTSSCCAPGTCGVPTVNGKDAITRDLYAADQAAELPPEALAASLGCGNPTMLATLSPGETVLDLGSGGGIDVLLSAKRVGPSGKAYGLDMTPEMLALARSNQQRAGVTNAEFLQGTIEAIPLPDASVDVVVSNCVINLSTDKPRVLRETFRVLRAGGRFAVSDVVLRRTLPVAARRSVRLWTGCVAGALLESDYVRHLRDAGFVDVSIEPTRVFGAADAREMVAGLDLPQDEKAALATAVDGAVMSAFVRARKPR